MSERKGIDRFLNKEDTYDLFGAKTMFREITGNIVEGVVKQGKWFSFCTRISECQYDIMAHKNKEDIKLGKFVADIYPDTVYRSAIYKYLLRDYLCYFEVPSVTKDTAMGYGYKSSYNKCLITSNLYVIALWLGISVEEAEELYGSRLDEVCLDNGCDMFQYVKLYETKEGLRKVTKPRKDLDLSAAGTRIIPVYALNRGVDILYELCKKDFYTVSFVKDGGMKRDINTTFSIDKLREVYGDTDFFRNGVEGMYNGDFINNPTLERGYIRVFEAGASKYDSALRSINYARILGFKKEEPDLTYINIDLSSVMDEFSRGINNAMIGVGEIVEMLDVFNVGQSRKVGDREIKTTQDLESWANGQEVLLSTVFLRQLALFMIGNPQWFGGYTGERKNVYTSTAESFDDVDFGLDMSM